MHTIDLRSDTVTKPSLAMREAMVHAEVGDDVYGEDPTVNRLEQHTADLLGFPDALFTSSGTQANFVALMAHCQRGDEYIVGQLAHTYKYEGGGAAVLGSIQPQPIEFDLDGTLDLSLVATKIKPDDFHFAKTRLLCLENTQGGKALPLPYLAAAREFSHRHGLQLHLDGARIFNAAMKHQVHVREISRHFDSVSLCLSKGLGAPIGSVLCGSTEIIARARRWRKVAGGGMRQAGILAAAGLYALEHNVTRLTEDHQNAADLATGLAQIAKLKVRYEENQTNMVFVDVAKHQANDLTTYLKERGILISAATTIRLVTHLDISHEDITATISRISDYFRKEPVRLGSEFSLS